jgi:hypothetical protein
VTGRPRHRQSACTLPISVPFRRGPPRTRSDDVPWFNQQLLSGLPRWPFPLSLLASDTSIDAALEAVELFECIREGGRDVGSGLPVQTISLD